jgi:hypothetical protein
MPARATLRELADRAQSAIDREEDFVFDVAVEYGQIFDNVKHMRWFRRAVAEALVESQERFAHLHVP